jgi:uncharacterized integral membrane protein
MEFNPYELAGYWESWGIPVEVIFLGKVVVLGLLIVAGAGVKRLYDRRRSRSAAARPAAIGRAESGS